VNPSRRPPHYTVGVSPRVRTLLLAVAAVGALGTLTELLLLAHYEGAFQTIPVVLLLVCLVIIV